MSILAWTLVAAAAAFPNPYEIGARRSGVEPKAAMVSVASSDLQRMAGVAQRSYFDEELRGQVSSGQLGAQSGDMSFDRMDYRFRVRRLDVRPAGDSFRVELDLAGVNLAIHTVYLDASRARTCTGVRVDSNQGQIPVRLTVVPRVTEQRRVELAFRDVQVGLTENNFRMQTPERCNILPGMNWLLARLATNLVNRMQGDVASALEAQTGRMAAVVNDELARFGAVELELPVVASPVGPFLARAKGLPGAISVNQERSRFLAGAYVDARVAGTGRYWLDELARLEQGSRAASFAALPVGFLDAVMKEAKALGVLKMRIDAESHPELASFLVAQMLDELIPDAKTRFPAGAPLALEVSGGGVVGFFTRGEQLFAQVSGAELTIEVAGAPYYHVVVGGEEPVELALDRQRDELSLAMKEFAAFSVEAERFASGLTPSPAAGSGMKREAFGEVLLLVEEIAAEKEPLFRAQLPKIELRNARVKATSVRVLEGAIVLGLDLEL